MATCNLHETLFIFFPALQNRVDGLITAIGDDEDTKKSEFEIILRHFVQSYYSIFCSKLHIAISVVMCSSAENHNPAESGGAFAETFDRPPDVRHHSRNP